MCGYTQSVMTRSRYRSREGASTKRRNTPPDQVTYCFRGRMHEVDHRQARRPPRPLLLLDVDGVLNPFASPTCPPGYREHDFFPDDDPPVRLNESHASWLPLLATRFDLAWATGWEDEANTYLSPLFGLPRLPVIRFPRSLSPPRKRSRPSRPSPGTAPRPGWTTHTRRRPGSGPPPVRHGPCWSLRTRRRG